MKAIQPASAYLFCVRETVLSDQSRVYDVLCNGEEICNALNESDAYEIRDELRNVLVRYEIGKEKATAHADKPLWQQMNALSHRFGFDSQEAKLCGKVAALLEKSKI